MDNKSIDLIYIDSEYVCANDSSTKPLTLQLKLTNYTHSITHYYVIVNRNYEKYANKFSKVEWELQERGYQVEILYDDLTDFSFETFLETRGYQLSTSQRSENRLIFFYAPTDLSIFFGYDRVQEMYLNGSIEKTRRIGGNFEGKSYGLNYDLRIMDIFGMYNTSLANAFKAYGVDTKLKELELDKSRMDLELINNPLRFFEYALGDLILDELLNSFTDTINTISSKAHNFQRMVSLTKPKPKIGKAVDTMKINTPLTTGTLVSEIFVEYLKQHHFKLYRAVSHLAFFNHPKDRALFLNDLSSTHTREGLDKLTRKMLEYNKKTVSGLGVGSSKGYVFMGGSKFHEQDILYNTLVQGGRCFNEYPRKEVHKNVIEEVIDIDLSGCYGSALNRFDYPFGHPKCDSFTQEAMTLKDFFKRYSDELVPNLWQIMVSGKLSFEQDLIASKLKVTGNKIKQRLYDEDTESILTEKVMTNFEVMLKEIQNGVITSDVWEVIEKVCSDKEKNEILKLKVVAYSYYPKSREVSVEEFIEGVEEYYQGNQVVKINGFDYPKHTWARDVEDQSITHDTRFNKWCRIPIKSFLNPFIELRKEWKSLVKTKGDVNDLNQNNIKLIINTLYGNLVSIYFDMGNPVVANNITASARMGVWMMSKALLTVQSITDGGLFSNNQVASLKVNLKSKVRLPSLNTLANRERYLKSRYVDTKKLIECPSIVRWVKENNGKIDEICLRHIIDFWSNYGLEFKFNIECKTNNTGCKAAYYGKADYLINTAETLNDEPKFIKAKARGAMSDDHPRVRMLYHIYDPKVYPKPKKRLEVVKTVGIKDWIERKRTGNKKLYNPDVLLPNDRYTTHVEHNPINAYPVADEEQYDRENRAKAKAKKRPTYLTEHYHFELKDCCKAK